ncbi:MAG: histidine--tRNA ligase [Clostridia bacterium]
MIKTPPKGMSDLLPNQLELRNYISSTILQTYKDFGYSQIQTPSVEHLENLTSNLGGDNEKLIFKILKRGEKLENSTNDLCDFGLRFDLTLPLSRFYSNNKEKLPTPFKAIQIGNVWRAERPQKGRFRQFTQCDIDILADDSVFAEIDLFQTTATALSKLGLNFYIRLNDRRLLHFLASEFEETEIAKVLVTLDKMDKIGEEGVKEELVSFGYSLTIVENFLNKVKNATLKNLKNNFDNDIIENLEKIIFFTQNFCKVVFDPYLVRGMGYYTGPIFEITTSDYNLSIGGGGRYDDMIGKFCGQKVCCCGFSIGFERIFSMLEENHFKIPMQNKTAFLIEKGLSKQLLAQIYENAQTLRLNGEKVCVITRSKNIKFQKQQLLNLGFTNFKDHTI